MASIIQKDKTRKEINGIIEADKAAGQSNLYNMGAQGAGNVIAGTGTKLVADTLLGGETQGQKTVRNASAAKAAANPYTSQMTAAQGRLSAPRPTYTDSYAGRIQQMEESGPAAYESWRQASIDNYLDKIQNREAFSYNQSENPLYRQMAARYAAQGKKAMQDTMARAAAMTGGYGSSYAASAGSQAYQQQMEELNDRALQLYQMERNNYDQEGSNLLSTLAALQNQESVERQNYESDRAAWYDQLNSLRQGQAAEYQQHQDALDQYWMDQQDAWNQYTYWNDLYNKNK